MLSALSDRRALNMLVPSAPGVLGVLWLALGALMALGTLDGLMALAHPLPACNPNGCAALTVLDEDGAATVEYAGVTFKVSDPAAFMASPEAALPISTKLSMYASYAYLTGDVAPAVVCSCA